MAAFPEVLLPPLTHRLEVSAGRLLKIWLVFAAIAAAGALGLLGLRSAGMIGKGETPAPLLILAVIFLIVVGFCYLQGRRPRAEFASIRRGDYLARWTYPATDTERARADAGEESSEKVRILFHLPFWAISVVGVGLGIVGAFAKSDPMVALKVGPAAIGIAIVVGLLFAVPAHFLTGVTRRIAHDLDPEVIFTRSGIYTPGRFLPVMDFIQSRRTVTLEAGPGDRNWLHVRVLQGTQQVTGMPNSTMGAAFQMLVPEGKEEEARKLADYFSA